MKRLFLNRKLIIRGIYSLIVFSLICTFAETVARASAELDHQYKLETVGFLKSWDNVDGLFSEYVASAYQNYFSHQSRFTLNDLSKVDHLLGQSKLAYQKALYDKDILSQIARATHTESLLRTKIFKEGSKYFFTLEWLHAPQMILLGSIQFTLEEPGNGAPLENDFVSEALTKNLIQLIGQVPFFGHITGRDESSVTMSLGNPPQVKVGDTLIIGTLDDVKKHPLLKKIVDWRISQVGKISIEQIDDKMAFGKILEEEPGRNISRFQKIYQVQSKNENQQVSSLPSASGDTNTPNAPFDSSSYQPKLGWISGGAFLGAYSRSFSSASSGINNSGGGLLLGGQIQGELWLTRNWFSQLEYSSGASNYSQHNVPTGADSPATQNDGVGASISAFKLSVGYSYQINNDLAAPKLWARLGYRTTSFSLPADSTEATGPSSFKSFFAGFGGEIPIRNQWGALASFDIRILTSTEDPSTSSSDFEFFLGAYRKLSTRMTVRGGLDIHSLGSDASSDISLSQKTITIGPSLLYYF